MEPPPPLPELLRARNAAFIREFFPWAALLSDRYYRAEVDGVENLSERASMIVSTHNGGIATPDLYCLFVAFLRRFGLETPAYAMAHKVALKIPYLGPMFAKFGAIPASRENGTTVLRHGSPLLVFPGGDLDALKPYSKRHEVVFGGRTGFIRLAIKEQVPIIPVVSVGAHEVMMVLNDGRRIAKLLDVDRTLRIKSVPVALGFPFGLTIAGLMSIPLPSKVRVRILPPINLAEPPSAAGDEERVRRCYDHVLGKMQRALTDLASLRRLPLVG